MKSFAKTVWASAIGFILGSVVLSIISTFFVMIIMAGAMAAVGGSTASLRPDSVLNIDMSKLVIGEQTLESDPFAGMQFSMGGASFDQISTVGILDAVKALESAAVDPNIKCVYIRPDAASDLAHLEEFRIALEKFRTSGKPVVAYVQTATNAGFYLASVADRVYMSDAHGGMNMLVGLNGRMLFVKDLLDILGVNMQLIRHGKYKSAGEMYIRNSASKENMEQNTVMINGMWKEMVAPIAARANMTEAEFNGLLDNLSLVDAGDFKKYGLVDELVTMDQMKEKLCSLTGASDYAKVNSISLADYVALQAKNIPFASDCIAVIYANGEIVDGTSADQVASKDFVKVIDEVRRNDKIKAVVLRVNSPGGSVVASTHIKNALDALKSEKPVVASYGSYAASGGYWISACSDYIFSDATTLTGSIGVFGLIPDFSKAIKKWAHVNVTSVPTNAHSDMYTGMRPLTEEEIAYTQKDIEAIYAQFTALVAQGRKMDVEKVDELGQGRVWTGRDALSHGLVDSIGTLNDAVEYAAALVGCPVYKVEGYPKPLSSFEQLMMQLQPAGEDLVHSLVESMGSVVCGKAAADAASALLDVARAGEPAVYARMPYVMSVE